MNLQKIIEKQEEYIAYLKRAIHSESIIDNITAGVRDSYDKELSSLKAQEESKTLEECFENNGFDFVAFELENEYSAKNLLKSIKEFTAQSHQVEMPGNVAKTETDTGKLIDMPDLTCDVCGRHPAVIVQTQFGRYCMEHAKYV